MPHLHPSAPSAGRPRLVRPWAVISAGLGLVVLLTACGSSSSSADKTTAPPATTTSSSASSTSPADTSSSATSATTADSSAATGSKAVFITKAEALCASTAVKAKAVPDPTGPTDYAAIENYTKSVLSLAPSFYSELTILAAGTPDSAELNSKWIAVEKSDLAVATPILQKLSQAAASKDEADATTLFTQLGALPDNSDTVSAFLTSYGLPTCAAFEGS